MRDLYKGLSPGDRFFVWARLAVLPLRDLFALVPSQGRVLDVGCGRGVTANALALARPRLHILGVDLDPHLIAVARRSIRGRENVAFALGNALALPERGDFDAVICIDLIHHLPGETHRGFLEGVRALLRPGGALVLKEIDRRPRWKYLWNYLHDMVVTRGQPIACRANADLVRLVKEAGYRDVAYHAMRAAAPYPQYAVTARPGDGSRNRGEP